MERRGFLMALLAVPAAAVGVTFASSRGLIDFDLTAIAKPMVPFNPLKTGTGLHAYLLERERAQAEIERLSRIPESVLEACRSGWTKTPLVPCGWEEPFNRAFPEWRGI